MKLSRLATGDRCTRPGDDVPFVEVVLDPMRAHVLYFSVAVLFSGGGRAGLGARTIVVPTPQGLRRTIGPVAWKFPALPYRTPEPIWHAVLEIDCGVAVITAAADEDAIWSWDLLREDLSPQGTYPIRARA